MPHTSDDQPRQEGVLPDKVEGLRAAASGVILLNFAHPLTAEQLATIEALSGQAVERVRPGCRPRSGRRPRCWSTCRR
jgi:hypothetical protein